MKRLNVQALERRQLMAADVELVDSTLYIEGTEGNDIAEVYTVDDSVVVKLQSTTTEGEATEPVEQTFDADLIDGIIFEAFAGDDLLVNDTDIDSIMRAGGGKDVVMGGGGNDILVAGEGADVVLGGGGSDTILGGVGNDVVIESEDETASGETDDAAADADDAAADSGDAAADAGDAGDADDTATDQDGSGDSPLAEDNTSNVDDTPAMEAGGDVVGEDLVGDDDDAEASADDPLVAGDSDPVAEDAGSEASDPVAVDPPAGDMQCDTVDGSENADDQPAADQATDEPVAEPVAQSDAEEPAADATATEPADQPSGDGAAANDVVAAVDGDVIEEDASEDSAETTGSSDPEPVASNETPLTPETPPAMEIETEPETDIEVIDPVAADEPAMDSSDPSTATPVETADTTDAQPVAVVTTPSSDDDDEEPAEPAAQTVVLNQTPNESDDDMLFGGGGNDWIFGEGGDDLIFGADSMLPEDVLLQLLSDRLA